MLRIKTRLISLVRRGTGLLPDHLRLRVLTWIDVAIQAAEPENVHIPVLAAKTGCSVAVDVGANNGVTSCLMARSFEKVHAFEANPRLAEELIRCAPAQIQVWPVALSSEHGEARLTIPISAGVTLEGWGSMETPILEGFDKFEHFTVKTRTLDSCALEDVGLIKIDVEGHEMSVLAGARDTLQRYHPWLIIEALDDQQDKVRQFLAPFGYGETTLLALTGITGSPHNLVFLPPSATTSK
jgi:FkbM family methyltransferase